MEWFVDPSVVRVPIGEHDYLDLKSRLTHGEQEEFHEMIALYDESGRPRMNLRLVRTGRVVTYLVGWSLTKDGQPVPMSPDMPREQRIKTIDRLGVDAFDAIHAAIVAHEAAIEAARKNEDRAPTVPASISTSAA